MIDVERETSIEIWSMNYPPVNAIGALFLEDLERNLARIASDPDVMVIVLTSALKVFSAGADAKWFAETVKEVGLDEFLPAFQGLMDRFREAALRIRQDPRLFIAAMNGHTIAGGLELAAACDLRFAADDDRIKIGVPEMKLFGALPSGGGGAQYLARLMGPSAALDFILEAEDVTPRAAASLGLVGRLYPADRLLDETRSFARTVAQRAGPIGIDAAKRALFDGFQLPLADAIRFDRHVHWDAMRRGNFLRGVEDFAQRFGG